LALYCLNHRVVENEKKPEAAADPSNGKANGAAAGASSAQPVPGAASSENIS